MRKFLSTPFYPLLMAPVPLLALVVVNISQASLWDSLRFTLLSILGGGLLTAFFWLFLRDWRRAAYLSLLGIILWNIYQYLTTWYAGLIALAVAVALALLGRKKDLTKLTIILNAFSLYLFLFPAAMALIQGAPRDIYIPSPTNAQTQASQASENAPDIYLIVLDSYAGQSVLMDQFNFDNSPFLRQLNTLGFETGECVHAGPQTDMSLAAMLNPSGNRSDAFWKQIRHSEVRIALEERGYQTVAYETGFVWDEWIDADFYLHPDHPMKALNKLEALSVHSSPLELLDGILFDGTRDQSNIVRERTYVLLAHLADPATLEGPQFTFAHFMQPHPPFVFDAAGNELPGGTDFDRAEYNAGYLIQLQYINIQMITALEHLIAVDPNSIIFLTGDHGPRFGDEWTDDPVLCAVYSSTPLPLTVRDGLAEIIK